MSNFSTKFSDRSSDGFFMITVTCDLCLFSSGNSSFGDPRLSSSWKEALSCSEKVSDGFALKKLASSSVILFDGYSCG